jgi:translation initiation factor 2 subunit 1
VKVHENGAYVVLLEYENMEGLILSTEVTKKRVKLINKFMRIGKQETMMVIRVDKDKRYIDLSKKKVQPEEAAQTEKYFKKAKMVHNILKQVAVKMDCTLLSLYEKFGWDLYDKYDHAYDAFRLIMRYEWKFH